jgi:microcystin degradation protein MlrC
LRIALGGLSHETNTYAVGCFGLTELDDFEVSREDGILRRYAGTRTFIGGMLAGAAALGAEVVPTVFAITQPSGTIARSAYDALKGELLSRIEGALPVDAVALDLHGNITERMAETIDLMLGVHYYPHTDMYERGEEAIAALPALLAGELRPVTHIEHLPMLLPTSTTDLHPAKSVNELCWELERQPGVIDCTFFHGFPFTDTPEVGVHIVCTTDGDRELAERTAKTVAAWIWEHREEFRPETETPEIAVRRAMAAAAESEGKGPVVINDTADNSGGGAPGDSTHLLQAMLDAGVQDAVFGFLYDPEVAAAAHRAGVGATIDVRVGGKHDELHGPPVPLRAYVKALTDGRFTYTTPMFGGMRANYGPMARLQVDGLDLLVGSARSQTFDTEVFLLHGIDVTRYGIVALKSSNHFRAGFAHLASEIVTADSPGLTTQRTEVFERTRPPGPLWPKDPEADYPTP